jgi:glycosyltransferase involved in cell wall biosynthesis
MPASKIPVSVIIMTKNEAAVIDRCIRSVTAFDEVFVVDSCSTDGTAEIAAHAGATVVSFVWNGEYPKKKQWCLDHLALTHDYVLFVDADEVVTKELAKEIPLRLDSANPASAYDAHLAYFFMGKHLKYGHRVTKRVLINRRQCKFPIWDDLGVENMWEVEGHYQPTVTGRLDILRTTLRHEDTDHLFDYFERHNRYSDWEAQMAERPTAERQMANQARSAAGRVGARVPAKSIVFFLYSYIVRLGFLDGAAGFHYAVAHSFYFWQIALKRREIRLKGG